jgi:hypothetical protein
MHGALQHLMATTINCVLHPAIQFDTDWLVSIRAFSHAADSGGPLKLSLKLAFLSVQLFHLALSKVTAFDGEESQGPC